MYPSAPIIKKIDISLKMLKILKGFLEDRVIAGSTMSAPKIAEAVNILEVLEKDWTQIRDDVDGLGDPII